MMSTEQKQLFDRLVEAYNLMSDIHVKQIRALRDIHLKKVEEKLNGITENLATKERQARLVLDKEEKLLFSNCKAIYDEIFDKYGVDFL